MSHLAITACCCCCCFGVPAAQEENLSTLQTFDMKRGQPLPPLLLPYLRLAFATTHEQLDKVGGGQSTINTCICLCSGIPSWAAAAECVLGG